MHSRIIQIETRPLKKDEFITKDMYIDDHWFIGHIADYVWDDEDRAGSLEWFKQLLAVGSDKIEYFTDENGEGFILRSGFHALFFSYRYQLFREELEKLIKTASPEAYTSGSLSFPLLAIEEAYDEKYGFYIENDDYGLETWLSFLRHAVCDVPYYFGGTVDYHS